MNLAQQSRRLDTPFYVAGGSDTRLATRSSIVNRTPSRLMQLTQVVPLYALADPLRPLSTRVIGHRTITKYLPKVNDAIIASKLPMPSEIGIARIDTPYLPEDESKNPFEIPTISSIETNPVGLELDLTALISNDPAGTTTISVAWGDGQTSASVTSGTLIKHTYASTGVYTIVLTPSNADSPVREYTVYVEALDYVAPLEWGTVTVTSPVAPSKTVTIEAKVIGSPVMHFFVDYADDTGSLQGYHSYDPVSYDAATNTNTFQFEHTFRSQGGYVISMYAEQRYANGQIEQIRKNQTVNVSNTVPEPEPEPEPEG